MRQGLAKGIHQSAHSVRLANRRGAGLHEPQANRQFKLCLQFRQGPACNAYELPQFAGGVPMTFASFL